MEKVIDIGINIFIVYSGFIIVFQSSAVEYITLTDWLIERNFYEQISKKRFFKKFRTWKIMRMWRRDIMHKKREEAAEALKEKYFFLSDVFGPILIRHKAMCHEMESIRFIDLSAATDVQSLEEFSSQQIKRRGEVEEMIVSISGRCRQEFKEGIKTVIDKLRKEVNEENENEESHK